MTPTYRTVTLSEALTYVWYAGMAGVGAWFLFTNLRFARALRKARTPYRVEGCRYPVYLVSALPSPCLFGVLRPAVYLNEKALQSPDALRFVLAHEQTHARHLDPLWSLLRGVCLTVYWFDPLVWLAAVLSREDGELACDEGTLRALGADERAAYGKTLLALVPVCDKPQNPLLGATTMTSGKRSLKERITRIAENRAGQGRGGVRRRRARGARVRGELHRRAGYDARGHAGMVRRGLHDRGRAGLSRISRLGGRLRRGQCGSALHGRLMRRSQHLERA